MAALPGLDGSTTRLALVCLAFLLAWSAVAALVPRPPGHWSQRRRWALRPCCWSLVRPACSSTRPTRVSAWRPRSPGTRRSLPAQHAFAHPALVVPRCSASCWPFAVLRLGPAAGPRVLASIPVVTLAVGPTATLALFPVPLWTIVAPLALAGAGRSRAGYDAPTRAAPPSPAPAACPPLAAEPWRPCPAPGWPRWPSSA